MMGNTRGTLERNILEPMRSLYGDRMVGDIRSDNTLRLFGKKVYALGADNKKHVSRIQGATFEYVYGDEVTTWSEDVFQMLKSRLRCEHSHFDGTCNPDSPTHWFKDFLDSDADIYQQSYVIDDGVLPANVVAELKKEYAGTVYYERYILGKWALAEGLIYPNFDNIVPTVARDYDRYAVSMDYGIQNPTAMLLWGRCSNVWYQIEEYYHSGRETNEQKTDQQYYDQLEKLCGDLPIKYLIIDPSATSFIALCEQKKRFRVWRANNAVLDGIQHTASCLAQRKILINDCCKRTIQEYGLYSWDDSAGEDRPIKDHDHCLTGDTLVDTVDGPERIKDIVGKSGGVWCADGGNATIGNFRDVRMTQEQAEVWEIELNNGLTVKATADHPVLTRRGWVQLKDLRGDDEIACIGGNENESRVQRG